MAKPRIFISSTFYDLKHVRSSLESFITSLGYEPVLSEKGAIAYSPSIPLDESCYRDAQASDVFVLIIGGRYGSEATGEQVSSEKEFFERYESITKKEYESAYDKDIPVYVLIDRSVYGEYDTYKNNKGNEDIKYAHVDSVNIFRFIEEILSRPRNNPVCHFERASEIEVWLRDQWAGLFKEMINSQSEIRRITSLSDQVAELGNINITLKRYMEEIVAKVIGSKQDAKNIINAEDKRLEDKRQLNELSKMSQISELKAYDINVSVARQAFSNATSIEDLLDRLETESDGEFNAEQVLEFWIEKPDMIDKMNKVRQLLGLPDMELETKISNTGRKKKAKTKSKKSKERT